MELTFDPDKVQTITVGGNVFQINPNPAKGAAMAAAATFTGTGTANDPFTVTRTADMTDEDIVAGIAAQLANGVTISGMKFNVAAEGTTLKFEAAAAGAVQIDGQDATEETFTAAVKAAVTSETKAPEGGEKPAGSLNVTANVGSDGKAKAEVDLSTELGKIPADPTQTKTVTLGGKTYVWGTGASTNNNEVDLSIADNAITAEAVKNAIKDKILDDAGTAYSSATAAWEGDKLILTNKAAGTGTWTTKVADVTPTETVAGGNATAGTAAATVGPDNLKAGDTLNVGDKTLNITEEHLADATALANAIKALNPTNFTVNAAADTTAGTVAITLTEKAGKEGTNNADALKGALGVTPAAPKNENGGSAGAAFAAAGPPRRYRRARHHRRLQRLHRGHPAGRGPGQQPSGQHLYGHHRGQGRLRPQGGRQDLYLCRWQGQHREGQRRESGCGGHEELDRQGGRLRGQRPEEADRDRRGGRQRDVLRGLPGQWPSDLHRAGDLSGDCRRQCR